LVLDTLRCAGIHDAWERRYRTPANERFYEQVFDELVRLIPRPGASTGFLDAGCGIGAHASRLARRGFAVEAVDVSDAILERARANLAAQGLFERVTVRQASLLALPYDSESFDGVLCWGVLMHVPNVRAAISELARVTRIGGTVVINEINASAPEPRLMRILFPRIARSGVRIERTDAGFEHWAMTAEGMIMWRHADIGWLVDEAGRNGLSLRRRLPGQFSELYAEMPVKRLADAVHALNGFWFARVRAPGPAAANVLLFEKS
jgi:2-polyprenyl-3-methyl-5-hydroxy-6-metoxy-1,4-benzoquinol methylase